ncbi:hypothetical protein JHK85_041399 [Glycine max]|nr:hypothetical protein JHK85_041399 [Glycine max]
MEDWLQLVIACYPFSTIGGPQGLKPARSISSDERKLLYKLFQKQRHVACRSAMFNQLTVVQMLLSKLMIVSVGYCWNEFNEEDWDFLLSNQRCWIQSAVVMMEDVAENINASGVVNSSSQARDKAVKSVDFWRLRKGSISSLYAILFTSKPIPLLQFAAYFVLSNEPVLRIAVLEDNACNSNIYAASEEDISRLEVPMEEKVHLKEEIPFMVERAPYEVLEMDLLAHQRSLPSSSSQRERLIQYIQDSATPVILDCLFQHIPVEISTVQILKKKDAELSGGLSSGALAEAIGIWKRNIDKEIEGVEE